MARQRELGAALARGNTSVIREWGRNRVAKVMLPETPPQWADLEADWMVRVRAAGLPVPEVFDVIDVDGRRAIVCQRVAGPTMLQVVVSGASEVAAEARRLAELQHWFHQVRAPHGLMDLRTRLLGKIYGAQLSRDVREPALTRLAALPDGVVVCHGDLHPGNVIRSGDGLVVVDWFDVASGNPIADVARTSLLIRPRRRGPPGYLPGATNNLLHEFHDAYLAAYEDLTGVGRDLVDQWALPVAAARMSEHVEDDPADLTDLI